MLLLRVAAFTGVTAMNAAVAAVSVAAGEQPGSLSGVTLEGKPPLAPGQGWVVATTMMRLCGTSA